MKNIFVFVADALRYDHVPESIVEEGGGAIPTLAPAGYTPISFPSMLTGLDPRNHSVRSFYDTLEEQTVLDRFENHSFYDHPEDALCQNIFRNYETSKELSELEEPFVYVERALDTHSPYGKIGHGNHIPADPDEPGPFEERYQEGVESVEQHFWSHVEELEERGILEDTLVIFTSDHGELLGEQILFRKRYDHNKPVCPELNVVPTVFLNHRLDASHMRTIDIVPTALSILGKEPMGDGLDVREHLPETGYTMLQVNTSPLIVTGCSWRYQDGWTPGVSRLKTDMATLAIDVIDPLRDRLRDTFLADILRPKDTEQRDFHRSEDELEDLDF